MILTAEGAEFYAEVAEKSKLGHYRFATDFVAEIRGNIVWLANAAIMITEITSYDLRISYGAN